MQLDILSIVHNRTKFYTASSKVLLVILI